MFSSLRYRDGDVELIGSEEKEEKEEKEEGSRTLTSTATSTVYSLIETAHPVFGRVKRLWNSPLENHREVGRELCAGERGGKGEEGREGEEGGREGGEVDGERGRREREEGGEVERGRETENQKGE